MDNDGVRYRLWVLLEGSWHYALQAARVAPDGCQTVTRKTLLAALTEVLIEQCGVG